MLLLFKNCQMYMPLRVFKLFIVYSNTITAFAQNCDSLDSDQSFGVTVCLRQCHSLVEMGKMPSECIFLLHKLYTAR